MFKKTRISVFGGRDITESIFDDASKIILTESNRLLREFNNTIDSNY